MEGFYLTVAYVLAGTVGLCVGSFLNVVVYRLPRGMSLARPASHCPNCGAPVRKYDNIPVLSWLLLGGKCRDCGCAISPRYALVELGNALLWVLCVAAFYEDGAASVLSSCAACSVILAIFFCDLENMWIPDSLQVALLLSAALAACAGAPLSRLTGGLLGGLFFLMFYVWSLAACGKEGIGFGDVKLMAGAGLLLGAWNTFLAVLFGTMLGAVCIGALKAARRDGRGTEYPLAPFLAIGILVALFCGDAVISWYAGLLG